MKNSMGQVGASGRAQAGAERHPWGWYLGLAWLLAGPLPILLAPSLTQVMPSAWEWAWFAIWAVGAVLWLHARNRGRQAQWLGVQQAMQQVAHGDLRRSQDTARAVQESGANALLAEMVNALSGMVAECAATPRW